MKRGAGADRAFDMDFAGVFLNDAVADGEAQAGAALVSGQSLGGKEGIVDALEMLGSDAGAGVGDVGFDLAIDDSSDAQSPAARHGVFGVQQQIEEDLLQLAGVAVYRRKLSGRIEIYQNLSGFELVFDERQRVA